MPIKAIIGLGNPGDNYRQTRHNVGFMIVDRLAQLCSITHFREKFCCLWEKKGYANQTIYLVKPQTYMNRSGKGIRPFLDYFKITPEEILIIHDDLDLPLGRIKLVREGGDGGHKGIQSIIKELKSRSFKRLKIGIGRPQKDESIEQFVLSPFYQDEIEDLEEVLKAGTEGVMIAIEKGIDRAMNSVNTFSLQISGHAAGRHNKP